MNFVVVGEIANVICDVQNQSTVDLAAIKTALMRRVTLRAHGRSFSEVERIAVAQYPGVKAGDTLIGGQQRKVPVHLVNQATGKGKE